MRRTIPFVLLTLAALAVATVWEHAPPTDARSKKPIRVDLQRK